jgi:hypothetical protein
MRQGSVVPEHRVRDVRLFEETAFFVGQQDVQGGHGVVQVLET